MYAHSAKSKAKDKQINPAKPWSAKSIERKTEIMAKFRFQDLEIWQLAIEIADELFDIAEEI